MRSFDIQVRRYKTPGMFHPLRPLMVLLVVLTAAVPAAVAGDHDDARNAVQSGQALPLGAIVGQVKRQYPGRLLDADMGTGKGGKLTYRLQWLTDKGNVLDVLVDARSGRVLNVKGKH